MIEVKMVARNAIGTMTLTSVPLAIKMVCALLGNNNDLEVKTEGSITTIKMTSKTGDVAIIKTEMEIDKEMAESLTLYSSLD